LTIAAAVSRSLIPERVDGEHLDVDAHRVHRRQTFLDRRLVAGRDVVLRGALDRRFNGLRVRAHQRDGIAEEAMGVHVNGRDPLAVDDDGLAPGAEIGVFVRTLRIRRIEQAAGAKDQARRGSPLDELPASRHRASPSNRCGFLGISGFSGAQIGHDGSAWYIR